MEGIIRYALSNFTLTFLILGLAASAASLLRSPRPIRGAVAVEAVFRYFLFFSIGISFFYNFVMHVFFGEMAARFIGWADSPFQAEVGYASLGISLLGFLACRGSFDLRLAAIIVPAAFLWGAAVGHVQQMVVAHNFEPGNAGAIFYTDIFLPLFGFGLLAAQRHYGRADRRATSGPDGAASIHGGNSF